MRCCQADCLAVALWVRWIARHIAAIGDPDAWMAEHLSPDIEIMMIPLGDITRTGRANGRGRIGAMAEYTGVIGCPGRSGGSA